MPFNPFSSNIAQGFVSLLRIMSSPQPSLEELIMCMRSANNPREQRVAAIQKMAW
jgi:hypothetical protein